MDKWIVVINEVWNNCVNFGKHVLWRKQALLIINYMIDRRNWIKTKFNEAKFICIELEPGTTIKDDFEEVCPTNSGKTYQAESTIVAKS